MADQDLELEEGEKKGKGKLIIIIAVVLLAGGGGAFFFLGGGDEAPAEGAEAAEEGPITPPKGPAIYVGVPEAMITPVKGEKKDRMLQLKISLVVRGEPSKEAVKKHMPRLKNDMLELASQSQAEVVITPDGRKALQQQLLEKIQQTMTELEGQAHVEKLLFVSFVMQ